MHFSQLQQKLPKADSLGHIRWKYKCSFQSAVTSCQPVVTSICESGSQHTWQTPREMNILFKSG